MATHTKQGPAQTSNLLLASQEKGVPKQFHSSPIVDDLELNIGPQRQARAVGVAGKPRLGPHPAAAVGAAAPPGLLLGARHAAPAALCTGIVLLCLWRAARLRLLASEAAVTRAERAAGCCCCARCASCCAHCAARCAACCACCRLVQLVPQPAERSAELTITALRPNCRAVQAHVRVPSQRLPAIPMLPPCCPQCNTATPMLPQSAAAGHPPRIVLHDVAATQGSIRQGRSEMAACRNGGLAGAA